MKERLKATPNKTQIKSPILESGESIEEMVRRCLANNEPIGSEAPMVYTEKSKGVMPEYDIRTDRQEIALDAIDKFQASEMARAKEQTQPESQPNNQEE